MLQCIGFASWRDGERQKRREGEREEGKKKRRSEETRESQACRGAPTR